MIDWFMEIVGVLSTKRFNGPIVGPLVRSIDGGVWIIDGFVRDTEFESVGKLIGELEGADVVDALDATEGIVAMVVLSVGSIVESSLHVVLNVVDIAIGFSVIIS